ncbi:hypothetical protein BLNAU_11238 [Blattamonas nauphoetae]|uniref:Serine-threonine/tyrosine-protein kinase catalytic domain-containing protein n=1 Tax=Blattamonas nauphoetae TaxID=2049346 RepID=A0ABQ9XRB1_9EUKA|nr:hypothetical protein BLNAU_11238 [Blattamonas nauphoetae]
MILLWISISALFAYRGGTTLSPSDYQSTSLPLSEALRNKQLSNKNVLGNEAIKFELAEGLFHTDGHHIVSQKVEIEGRNTMILHSNQSPPFSSTNNEQPNPSISNQKAHPSIFIVTNSSLALKSLILSVWKGGLVCFVDSSDVGLVGCRIGSSVECSPLVVSSPTLSRSTTITMIGCCHSSSESWVVHPFVGVDQKILPNDHSSPTDKQIDKTSEELISVIGCDLSFSTWLFGRSGPLLEMDTNTTNEFRCPDGQSKEEICTTTLVKSSFVNVSSLSLGSGIPTHRPRLTQNVIGCSMLRSTDHFRGTALRDMNTGGNVLCSNSSFAHCSSASSEDITQGGRCVYNQTTTSTLTFTSCTFRHMTCKATLHVGGAAIALDYSVANLTIILCAFHDCNASDSSADGSAVCFLGKGENVSPDSTVSISQCSFTDCSTVDGGGAVVVFYIQSISLDDCFFRGNSARVGGAICHQNMISSTISNSSFEENLAAFGGAIHYNSIIPFMLTDHLFRDNVATQESGGSDLSFSGISLSYVPEANLTRCDTSSAKPTIWFSGDRTTDSTRLNRVSLGFAISSCSVTHSETTSTVTIKTLNAVSGVMSVLLSGGLVPRLVFVSFESAGSTTGTGTTTTTVLPSTNEYTLEAAVLAGFQLESSILGAVASLITPNTTKIDLTGTELVSGSYSMLVEDASGTSTNISLTVSSSTELSTTMALYPVSSAELKYGTKYTVMSVMRDTMKLAMKDGVSFITPDEPARIVGIWGVLDKRANTVSLTLRGRQIVKGSYTVRLNSESGPSFSISFSDGLSDERNSSPTSFSLFSDSSVLSPGVTYTIFSVVPTSLPSTSILIDANPNSFILSEPSRITDVTIGSLSDAQKTEATLTMTGLELEPNTDYKMHVTGHPKSTSLMRANTEADKRTITIRSDSSDPSETGSKTIKFYPLSSADLLFGYEYYVDSVTLDGSTLLQNSGLSFSTPIEPARLISISPVLSASLETVSLTFSGRCFDGDFTVNLQVTSPTQGTQFELQCSSLYATELTLTLPISSHDLSSVEFGDVLSVLSLKNDSSSAILEMSTFSIPHPPRVETAAFSFCSDLNTTFSVTLCGTDLPSNERFLVVLDSDYSFEIVITNSSSGTSTEMAIGWTDSLQYDTEYRIVSIRNEETGRNVFVDSSVTFTTEKRPNQIVVFFDSSSSDSSRLCGKKDEPCSSMDSAWKIASNVGASDVSLRLILNATLSSPIVCLSNGIVVVEKGTSTEPTLIIPSSASMGENGMISISCGLFEIRDVDVVIESIVPSFVLLSGIDSTIVLRDGLIVGVKTRNEWNSDEVCCEWETGILQLSNCTTNITETVLYRISQGVVNVRGGNVTIFTSSFSDNSPGISSFSSFRQNIRCSEGGEIEIGSLHGGDGSSDKHCHLWLSHDECYLLGADVNLDSPFFIPTLSPMSTSSFNKKDKTFTLEMIGTTLIPCDLFLEVFEVSKQKTIGKAERMKLDLDTTTSFTESSISLTLSHSSLSSLDSSLEWRGRLIFGENERSSDSFLIQANSVERRAQAMKENMKWWLPVAIVLAVSLFLLIVIVFFCWRRRRQVPSKSANQPEEMEDAEIIVKMEERDELVGQSVVETSVRAMKDKTITAHGPEIHGQTEVTGNEASDGWDGRKEIEVIEVMDCVQFESHFVSRQNSLYHRLHVENRPLTNKRIQERHLVSALAKLKGMNGNAEVFIHLSTHWLKMTTEGEICLLLEKKKGVEKDKMEGAIAGEQELKVDCEREKLDGQRWSAPEQFLEEGEAEKAINPVQVSVFRLGLVLWEIETGQIPFGETDAVNTCRQLKAGIVPAMDGVSSLSMRDLITRCLSVDGDSRPSLESVLSTLNGIEEDATTWKDTLHF